MRRITSALTLIFSAFALVAVAMPANAIEGASPLSAGELLRAWSDCASDRERYCANVERGGGRIVRCLVENHARVSPRCQPHVERAMKFGEAFASCSKDVERFCYNVTPGGGRVASCLAGNRDRLSPACRRGIDYARSALR